MEDSAPSITVQPIESPVTLGDFADVDVPAAFSFLGELLRFRTSDAQNDVTPLCEGVFTLDDELASVGRNEVVWRGRDQTGRQLPSGTYFYRLEAGAYSESKRMALIK